MVVARGVVPGAGVHWLDNQTLLCLFEHEKARTWASFGLEGGFKPRYEVDNLGEGDLEVDVRRRQGGAWSYVAGRLWRSSDGGFGHLGGGCSGSLSPDGKSLTALQGGHTVCKLNAIVPDGWQGSLRWPYAGIFDNHRWSSNDPRFITCVEERSRALVVMKADSSQATRIGDVAGDEAGNIYADFTRGSGEGGTLPKRKGRVPEAAEVIAKAAKGSPDNPVEPIPAFTRWPGDPAGTIFLWENAKTPNEVTDLQSGRTRKAGGRLHGPARFTAHHALDLRGGSYLPEDIGRQVREQTIEGTQFFLEATVRMEEPGRSAGKLISFGDSKSPPCFVLEDIGGELWWTFRSDSVKDLPTEELPAWRLGPISANKYHHVLITWKPNQMVAWLDGQKTFETPELGGNVWCWPEEGAGVLALGRSPLDDPAKTPGWEGTLEAVAIGDRYLEPEFVAERHELARKRLQDRIEPERHSLRATLLRKTKSPAPKDIAPYHRCLVECLYRIEETLEGDPIGPKGTEIAVLEWSILDDQPVPNPNVVGNTARLILESVDAHPELRFERSESDIESLGLPKFIDVGR